MASESLANRLWWAHLGIAGLVGVLATVLYSAAEQQRHADELKKEVAQLRERQLVTERDIDALREQSRRDAAVAAVQRGAQRDLVLSLEGAIFKGKADAAVTMIEFGDYQCPFCSAFERKTMPQLQRDYIGTGKLRFAVRSFPLDFHNLAFRAHEAAACAAEQGKFWEMHERLLANSAKLNGSDMPAHAEAIHLDKNKFATCFDAALYAPQIHREIAEGQKNGVTGTPTFFLGLTNGDAAELRVVRVISGAVPFASFKEAIDALLDAAPSR